LKKRKKGKKGKTLGITLFILKEKIEYILVKTI